MHLPAAKLHKGESNMGALIVLFVLFFLGTILRSGEQRR
jgi:hypothetical protein